MKTLDEKIDFLKRHINGSSMMTRDADKLSMVTFVCDELFKIVEDLRNERK